MKTTDLEIGDLVYFEIHQHWAQVLSVTPLREHKVFAYIRLEIFRFADHRKRELVFAANTELKLLNKYKFFRDGEQML